MSIQYLNTSTQMKIRPVSDEDVLFEMETNEFMTICCRVNTSYDLVVRDITSGAMLFCISGAEIEDHPLKVYISKNQPIVSGEFFTSNPYRQFPVEAPESGIVYVGTKCTITVTPRLVTLDWSKDISMKIKALTIATAINLAMTKHQPIMLDGTRHRQMQRVEGQYPVLLPSTQSEACPEANRRIPASIFEPSRSDQHFYLTGAAFDEGEQTSTLFLMDEKNKQVLIHVISKHSSQKCETFEALHIDGKEQFTAIESPNLARNELTILNVQYKQRSIGQVTYNNRSEEYKLNWHENGVAMEILSKTSRISSSRIKSFEGRQQHGTFSDHFHELLDITLYAGTSSIVKKLIICAAIYYFGHYMKMFYNLPLAYISQLMCNCKFCQTPNILTQGRKMKKHIYTTRQLRLKVAGHSKRKNVVYLDVCQIDFGAVMCTLEITPIQDFKGISKIEGRGFDGSIAFTSLYHQQADLFSVYNKKCRLVSYIVGNNVFDARQKHLFQVRDQPTKKKFDKKRFGSNVEFLVDDLKGNNTCMILSLNNILRFYRAGLPEKKPSNLEIFIHLTLAVKYYSYTYHLDRLPSPEIVYCYQR